MISIVSCESCFARQENGIVLLQLVPHLLQLGNVLYCILIHFQPSTESSTREQHNDNQGKEKARKSETEQAHWYSKGSVSSLGSPILLCREGIPQTLEDLYKAMDVGTIHEAAWVVIHVLMMETGYICASEVVNCLKKVKARSKTI